MTLKIGIVLEGSYEIAAISHSRLDLKFREQAAMWLELNSGSKALNSMVGDQVLLTRVSQCDSHSKPSLLPTRPNQIKN